MKPDAAATLPDLLRPGLDIVFVGINPSVYSVQQGHYFARKINRFWPCFSLSALSAPVRRGLGVARLEPVHDVLLPDYGFGFTDLVKRATPNVTGLTPQEMAAGAGVLRDKLAHFQAASGLHPRRHHLSRAGAAPRLWARLPSRWGRRRRPSAAAALFVVPNPSPANAHFTPAQQVEWYDRLTVALASMPEKA